MRVGVIHKRAHGGQTSDGRCSPIALYFGALPFRGSPPSPTETRYLYTNVIKKIVNNEKAQEFLVEGFLRKSWEQGLERVWEAETDRAARKKNY